MATDRYVCETVDKSILGLKMDAHHSHDSVRRSYHSFRKITGSKLPQIVTTRRVHPPYTIKGLRQIFTNGRSVVLCHPPPLLFLISLLEWVGGIKNLMVGSGLEPKWHIQALTAPSTLLLSCTKPLRLFLSIQGVCIHPTQLKDFVSFSPMVEVLCFVILHPCYFSSLCSAQEQGISGR